jgi:predicted Zn finger-like uncharacterized protein
MSLITCCPSCATMFRVVPDQLRISEGWVRCGHCAEVFDATAHMMDPVAAPVEGPDTQPAFDDAPPAVLPPAPARPRGTASRPAALAPTPPEVDVPDSRSLEESPLDQPFVFRRSDMGDVDDLPSVSPPVAPPLPAARGGEAWAPSSHLDEDAALDQVSFMRHARRRAFWRRRSVRAGLTVALMVLGALLALQVAVQDRDRLAAAHPELRAALQQMCAALGCTIGPPRQIEAIAIDSSAFNKLRGDAYRLSVTLRNQAPTPVAVPAVELTLTDSQDQPVVRRVLTPAELGAASPVIGAAAEWSASVTMALSASGMGRVAGYRLLAFYP